MFPNIKAEMARRGINQYQLATKLGVSKESITRWLNGKSEIPLSALRTMAKEWGVSLDYLVDTNPTGARETT